MLEEAGNDTSNVEAAVVEILPRATYRVMLANRRSVLAHAAGAGTKNFVRLREGDRVEVKISSHDPTRGRIIRMLD
jgi:translation initiation factor IF-1